MLSGMEFRIEEAADGVAALAAVAAHHPDVMILDLLMPEMNGLVVLDTLRDTGQIDGLSILVITGSITPASVLREKGAQGVLRKTVHARGAVRGGRSRRRAWRPDASGLPGNLPMTDSQTPFRILIVDDDADAAEDAVGGGIRS
jgi:PleD family two-component response regulator